MSTMQTRCSAAAKRMLTGVCWRPSGPETARFGARHRGKHGLLRGPARIPRGVRGWGKLRRVQREINKDTELHPLVKWQFRGLDEEQRTGWLFDNLTDLAGRRYEARVASAVLAPSRSVYAMGL